MFLLSIVGVNANKTAVAKCDQLVTMAQVQNFQVYCISEADVNTFSGPGYLQAWRSRGWTAALSEGLEGISKVALASSHHFRIIRLPTEEASGRHVAGIFEFRNQQQKVIEVLIVAFYGCPQSEARAQAQAMDVLMAAKSTGLPFIVAGDWNTTQETGALARAIQNQAVLACDEVDLSSNLPATGPIYSGSRRRRIDFAIAENHCSPVGLAHHANAALSDHLLVQYDFDFSAALPWVQPARNPIRKDITEREAEAFFSHVDASAFNEFLGRDDVDMAWQWLSDTAESCLCQHIEHPMRSEPWEPSIIPRKRFQGCVSGSRGYKALLKLQARLQVLANRPWDTALHQRLQSSLYHVRQLCPELPHLDLFAPEAAHVVQKLLQQYRQVEQQVMREQWRRCTQNDPSRIRQFRQAQGGCSGCMGTRGTFASRVSFLPESGRGGGSTGLQLDGQVGPGCSRMLPDGAYDPSASPQTGLGRHFFQVLWSSFTCGHEQDEA